jgi:hypothetical protein
LTAVLELSIRNFARSIFCQIFPLELTILFLRSVTSITAPSPPYNKAVDKELQSRLPTHNCRFILSAAPLYGPRHTGKSGERPGSVHFVPENFRKFKHGDLETTRAAAATSEQKTG